MKFIFIIAVSSALSCLHLCPYPLQAAPVDSSQWVGSITSADAAYKRALEYTGFEKSKGYTSSKVAGAPNLITAADTVTPLIKYAVNGQRAWAIHFSGITIDSSITAENYPSEFEVLIDSATGQLIKIESNFVGYDPAAGPPPPEMLEKMTDNRDNFRGLPDAAPKCSFVDALRINGNKCPTSAMQISASYIMFSMFKPAPASAWCLVIRGGEPFATLHSKHKYHPLVRIFVIDDISGDIQFGGGTGAAIIDTTNGVIK
jgi:hypothetical protein